MSKENVIGIARGELGVTEDPPGSNRTKYWEAYDPAFRGSPGASASCGGSSARPGRPPPSSAGGGRPPAPGCCGGTGSMAAPRPRRRPKPGTSCC